MGLLLSGCAGTLPPARVEGRHLVLATSSADAEARHLLGKAEETVDAISAFLGIEPPARKGTAILFRWSWSRRRYLARECPRMADAAAACFEKPKGCFQIVLHDRWSRAETLRLLRHEVTHFAIASRYYDIPPWLDEGLGRFFEMGPPYGAVHPKSCPALKGLIARRRTPLLPALIGVPAGERFTKSQYDQAWGLVWFLLTEERWGGAAVRRYLAAVNASEPPDAIFARCFGMTPEEMETLWRAKIVAAEGR